MFLYAYVAGARWSIENNSYTKNGRQNLRKLCELMVHKSPQEERRKRYFVRQQTNCVPNLIHHKEHERQSRVIQGKKSSGKQKKRLLERITFSQPKINTSEKKAGSPSSKIAGSPNTAQTLRRYLGCYKLCSLRYFCRNNNIAFYLLTVALSGFIDHPRCRPMRLQIQGCHMNFLFI